MRPFLAASLLAIAAVTWAASPSLAFFRITTIACDTVGTNPLQVRTTFNLDFVGPVNACSMEMDPLPAGPLPADSTHFFGAVAPPGWFVLFHPAGPPVLHFAIDTGQYGAPQCFYSGAHYTGFQVIANRAGPCAHFVFPYIVGFDGPDAGDGCMVLDGPVPAQSVSWGKLKSVYRE
jgi:hypothetical protein